MSKEKIIISGFPGNVAMKCALAVSELEDFELSAYGLTGEDINETNITVNNETITLLNPGERAKYKDKFINSIGIDYTTPSSYVDNCMFFIESNIPFIIGTSGAALEDIETIINKVESSNISAIIDANMSIELSLVGAALQYLATEFPNTLKNHTGYGFESHQKGKKDNSGTLIKWGDNIKDLGVNFEIADGIRNTNYGHAYHNLSLSNSQGNLRINLRTEVEGRDTYVEGTMLSLSFLSKMLKKERGKVYSMLDVLKSIDK